jgi:hypothetical protein
MKLPNMVSFCVKSKTQGLLLLGRVISALAEVHVVNPSPVSGACSSALACGKPLPGSVWWCVCLRWLCINLVDPASSHMLVSKIKPCMSQYKLLHGETANGSLKQLSFIW